MSDTLPPETDEDAYEGGEYGNGTPPQRLPEGWLRNWPIATFLLPLVVFMLATQLEPTPPSSPNLVSSDIDSADSTDSAAEMPAEDTLASLPVEEKEQLIPYRYYPVVYTVKIALVIAAMIAVWPGYRTFPFHVSPLAIVVGVVGVVLWIVLCKLDLEVMLLKPIGLGWLVEAGERSAFNPLEQLKDTPLWAFGFLAIRLIGLAIVVPVIEEFFLRGLVMRFVVNDNFDRVPFGYVTPLAIIAGTAVPMLMHPAELLAAFVWFSLITWLMVRTKNIWDCVVAHAVTNLLLGIYVIATGEWYYM
ncbi:CAAX prenyl protease-related protein [Adhaeretor mobilis]|uniref:CAAX amino terminal protease self-immunity n=1 Tax=Adhaeretor mobilis TaxID=1930276 RepID=A0A517MQ17_9BACT|nr:CAAX prenyl protease-related protein [Adhaeretor mobilis]QDS96980.1 CAAX amino terminal protease self- immunity [Adhaeretor mobilis]